MNLDESELKEGYIKVSEQLRDQKQLLTSKSAGPILLEDFFVQYNGYLNAIHGSPIGLNDDEEVYTYGTDVPVTDLGAGQYAIDIADYKQFYTEVLNNLNIQTQNGGYLHLTGFELLDLDPTNATIRVSLFIATPNPPVTTLFPSSAWYYVGDHEECATGLSYGNYDAADVLESHLVGVASFNEQCTNSVYMPIFVSFFYTWDLNLTRYPSNVSINDVINKLHHANNYQCVGDDTDPQLNDDEWNAMFDDARDLFDLGRNAYNSGGSLQVIWTSPEVWEHDTFRDGGLIGYGSPTNSFSFGHYARVSYVIKVCI